VQLDHEFTVPVPAEQAWPVLLDVERIGPCMPGATITSVDGKDFEGRVKVKVGPISVTYAGQASFIEVDDEQRRAVISAKGKEARGSGTASATITAQLHDEGDSTRVTVLTDLAITGRPAQFGRGVMADVGGKLLQRFADCLAGQLSGDDPVGTAPAAAPTAGPTEVPAGAGSSGSAATETATEAPAAPTREAPPVDQTRPRPVPPPEDDAINLLEVAGGSVLKRLAPIAGLLLLVLLIARLRRRRS
jgi:carbon monoxide dehydrogenase subunit G